MKKWVFAFIMVLMVPQLQAENGNEGFLFKTQINYESARISLLNAKGQAFYVEALSSEKTTPEQLVEKAIQRTLEKVSQKQVEDIESRKKESCQVSNGLFKSPLIEFEIEDVRKETFDKVLVEFKKVGFCKSLDYF